MHSTRLRGSSQNRDSADVEEILLCRMRTGPAQHLRRWDDSACYDKRRKNIVTFSLNIWVFHFNILCWSMYIVLNEIGISNLFKFAFFYVSNINYSKFFVFPEYTPPGILFFWFRWGRLIYFRSSVEKIVTFFIHFPILGKERSLCSPTLTAPMYMEL